VWWHVIVYFALVLLPTFALAKLLGNYMYYIFHKNTLVENVLSKVWGANYCTPMSGKGYIIALFSFNLLGIGLLSLLQHWQHLLPLNPNQTSSIPWGQALHTAISFITGTNWQNYAGEQSMSHLTQALGLAGQNFLAAACAMSIGITLVKNIVTIQQVSEKFIDFEGRNLVIFR
jgi:K+-transporting ATPase ATPase A chain